VASTAGFLFYDGLSLAGWIVTTIDAVPQRTGVETALYGGGIDDWTRLDRRSTLGKRAIDLLIGVPLALLALPVILILAAVLAVYFRTNPFFVHKRIGEGGELISIPKLRTLAPDTHPYADKVHHDVAAPHRFTAFLRARHIDELPQLLLVPLGKLSLVGPRPRMENEAELHGDELYNELRTSVPQGCTGLWQVSQGASDRVSDHPEYDLLYLSQHTLRLDCWILWRTLHQAVGGTPVRLDEVPRRLLRDPDALLPLAL
jgi:lipopolysaccharide/colanic/teichoic acid biosynthesis glycosyltransferase